MQEFDGNGHRSCPGHVLNGVHFWWRLFGPPSIFRKSPLPVGLKGDPKAAPQPGSGELGPLAVLIFGWKPKRGESSTHALGLGSVSSARAPGKAAENGVTRAGPSP